MKDAREDEDNVKKPHWTQTPKGRRILKERAARRAAVNGPVRALTETAKSEDLPLTVRLDRIEGLVRRILERM